MHFVEIPLTVHSLENAGPLYTVQWTVDGESVVSIVDTGSTGLIVAKKSAQRKEKTCKDQPKRCQFMSTWKLTFVTCYADGTGYFVSPENLNVKLGTLKRTKVAMGRAVGVFDPYRSMLTNDEQVFVSILGFGAHGNNDCSFSDKDTITQIIEKNSLHHAWSLRSVTATLEARMYIGASALVKPAAKTQEYTSLTQFNGKYIVVASGFLVTGTGRRSEPAQQRLSATEFILDTGKLSLVEHDNCICSCDSPYKL